jgi:hypothetical protein
MARSEFFPARTIAEFSPTTKSISYPPKSILWRALSKKVDSS